VRHLTDNGGSFDPGDIWRSLARADLQSLGGRGFPLYGPASPRLERPTLASWDRRNDALVSIVLSRGSLLSAEGPYVAVQTAMAGTGRWEHPLEEVVEEERDRLFQHAGIEEGGRGEPAAESEPWFPVDGTPVQGVLRAEGRLWAARIALGGPDSPLRGLAGPPVAVTITGRGIAPERVGLRTVEDLEPYAYGRQQQLAAIAEHRSGRSPVQEPVPPAPLGLDAHRRLIEYTVQDALRIEADLRSGHGLGRVHGDRQDRGELWETAVRQQMRLAGEDRDAANEAVTALVNQMIRLAEQADWFPGTEDAKAAVEESIRYTVFDSEVPSLDAQHAWRAAWGAQLAPGAEVHPEAGEQWLESWRSWRNKHAAERR
jgi:hypothetical protein